MYWACRFTSGPPAQRPTEGEFEATHNVSRARTLFSGFVLLCGSGLLLPFCFRPSAWFPRLSRRLSTLRPPLRPARCHPLAQSLTTSGGNARLLTNPSGANLAATPRRTQFPPERG